MKDEPKKTGRPPGTKAKEPRKGGMFEAIVDAYDKTGKQECHSTGDIIRRLKRVNGMEVSSSVVSQCLNRWRPEWKEKYHPQIEAD